MQQNHPTASSLIILKKTQGSVWREAGRSTVCVTPEWLSKSFGEGEYELRLKRGNRVVCMVGVNTQDVRERRERDRRRDD